MKEFRVKGEESIVMVFSHMKKGELEKKFVLCGGGFLDMSEGNWHIMRAKTVPKINAFEWILEAIIPFPLWQHMVMSMTEDDIIDPMTEGDFECTEQRELSE